jgi:hypothetical protein
VIVGSFCLFCENGVGGLPTVTKVSGLPAAWAGAAPNEAAAVNTATSSPFFKEARMFRARLGI